MGETGRPGPAPGPGLVLGAGPIGLLAALLGVQRGYEVHVLDQLDHGRKPEQVRRLGATYHTAPATLVGRFDAVVECTGALTSEAVRQVAPVGTICLIGEGETDRSAPVLALGELTSELILANVTMFGCVSSNRRHSTSASKPAPGRPGLVGRPAVRRPGRLGAAFAESADQIKAVINFRAGPG